MKIELQGRIDSGNASEIESSVMEQLKDYKETSLEVDAEKLQYVSSAGLRILLRLRKKYPELKITGVNSEIFEILEMTGFTEMMTVEKAYRVVSVEGCEVIGEGANGKVYRIDQDNVVKTYKNADALTAIQNEREVAKLALILGIPTAISYEVVKVGDSYGSVFELLDSRSFAKILAEQPEKMDWCVNEYVELLRKVHSTVVPEGKLPQIKNKAREWTARTKEVLPADLGDKLVRMIEEIPERNTMIHGDYHTKNVVLAGDEVMLIDMDTLSVGHPIFELAQMFNSFIGFGIYDPEVTRKFQGVDPEIIKEFWEKTLRAYLRTDDEAKIREIEDKIRVVGYDHLVSWGIRHHDPSSEKDKATDDLWRSELTELLGHVDSLDFDTESAGEGQKNELDIEATIDNLQEVMDFVEGKLEPLGCSMKAQMQVGVAVEEIFVNISKYAYFPDKGRAVVRVEVAEDPARVTITFIDHGIPYDPLAKEDPDVTLSAEEREIGGLGTFMTKQLMDEVEYEYKDGQNILTLRKNL